MHFFTRILASTDVAFKIIINRIVPFLLEKSIEGYVIVKQNIIRKFFISPGNMQFDQL